jgi:molybdopterin-dependent oxidoreductase alpha subunit
MSATKLTLEEGSQQEYPAPSGGYGSLRSVAHILLQERVTNPQILAAQNKPDGFMCASCAWGKPSDPHPAEFCENGAKATAWEITSRRTSLPFFAQHTVSALESWRDYDLEQAGRLTHPLRYDAASDRYVPVSWRSAFEEIGRELRAIAPDRAVFYASGRASLETSYMYQLMARMYGSNHLPDSSNMCHESTSVALPESIGAPVGTVTLTDFAHCDVIFYVGQNVGTSSPRMLHQLQEAVRRGCKIITINPLRERALESFTNPQDPAEMLTFKQTPITSQYMQVRNGGDIAALFGISKALLELDDARGEVPIVDRDFIAEHTTGFDDYAAAVRAHDWAELERVSGLTRAEMTEAAQTYSRSRATVFIYGMGLTQHVMGCQNVHMICNLMLLRGMIGKPGAGICPVRGHSNVQGQRTVGITEKPELAPLDKLRALYGFDPPTWTGRSTTEVCEGVISGEIRAFIGLGGNFVRAVPETEAVEKGWKKLRLTVQIATKLNRSHVTHGEVAYLLPCLGRLEIDRQQTGEQAVSTESSVAHFHGSRGKAEPASPELRSEPWIVAHLAKAILPPNPKVDWDAWVADYSRIRDAIEATYPTIFARFNERLFTPGGIMRPVPARERKWTTRSGKANFLTPERLFAGVEMAGDDSVFQLATLRSNDQFNTTIYGYTDRFRGVEGTRHVVFLNADDIARLGLEAGQAVDITTAIDEGTVRTVRGFQIVPYDIPPGCAGAYFPEVNPLIPVTHHDGHSKVPAYKALPVRLARSRDGRIANQSRDGLQGAVS